MFKRTRKIGEIHKRETDWGAIFGTIFLVGLGLLLLLAA